MILVNYFRDFLFFIPIAAIGWVKVLFRFLIYQYTVWQKESLFTKTSILVLFFQLVFATRPWFEYKIQFNEVAELLSVSSKVNLIFIFLSLANFILLLINASFSRLMIFILQAVMGILFLVGYKSPTSLHIDFINPADYNFNLNFYLFASVYFLAAILSTRVFWKNSQLDG